MVAIRHNILRGWRRDRGLSAENLARRLGVGRSTLYRYEMAPENAGARVPDKRVMALIWAMSEGVVGPAVFYELPELETGHG